MIDIKIIQRAYFFCLIFLSGNLMVAQSTVLSGQVLDAVTNKPIKSVNVQVANSAKGVSTDDKGLFEITISRFPISLTCSHISYKTEEIKVDRLSEQLLTIYLFPSTSELDEIVISSERKETKLSTVEKYSVQDFEIIGKYILRLEYHGSFKGQVVSLLDLEGNSLDALSLKKNKERFNACYKSCNNLVYLTNGTNAQPIEVHAEQLSFGSAITIDTFERFIEPCKAIVNNDIYYLLESVNGMRRDIRKYNIEDHTMMAIRTIADAQQIDNYRSDLGLIRRGQRSSNNNAKDITPAESRRIRRLQASANFRSEVFYKPNFPVFLFVENQELLIFNHLESKIEVYQKGEWKKEIKIDYPADKNWLKQVVFDTTRKKVYVLLKNPKGILLKELNTKNGNLQTIDLIPTLFYQLGKVRVSDGELFYIKTGEGSTRELIKFVL
ncbi:MAG: hypothetical protein ACI956_000372 [Nonlabens sp.]|jgi:hypothetical protein